MSSKRCSIEEFAAQIGLELEQYNGVVTEDLKKQVKASAKECVDLIKEKAPRHNGDYADSWKQKSTYEDANSIRCVCYAGSGEYRLTHLLENGHAKAGGGRVEAKPHIAPAEEEMRANLDKRVEIICRGSEGSE